MAYEQNDMSGSLFAAKNKKTDKHPDREGSAKIDGVEYWISGWVKQDRNGNPWMSLAFKRKDAREDHQNGRPAAKPIKNDMDDSIPFLMEWR